MVLDKGAFARRLANATGSKLLAVVVLAVAFGLTTRIIGKRKTWPTLNFGFTCVDRWRVDCTCAPAKIAATGYKAHYFLGNVVNCLVASCG